MLYYVQTDQRVISANSTAWELIPNLKLSLPAQGPGGRSVLLQLVVPDVLVAGGDSPGLQVGIFNDAFPDPMATAQEVVSNSIRATQSRLYA